MANSQLVTAVVPDRLLAACEAKGQSGQFPNPNVDLLHVIDLYSFTYTGNLANHTLYRHPAGIKVCIM